MRTERGKKKTDNEAGGREIKKSCSGRIRSNRIKHAKLDSNCLEQP